eukprot:3862973-Amphidinium_carterae.1
MPFRCPVDEFNGALEQHGNSRYALAQPKWNRLQKFIRGRFLSAGLVRQCLAAAEKLPPLALNASLGCVSTLLLAYHTHNLPGPYFGAAVRHHHFSPDITLTTRKRSGRPVQHHIRRSIGASETDLATLL